ncbi:MAG: FliH/SctL family protein [Sphingomonadaceae bacterium]
MSFHTRRFAFDRVFEMPRPGAEGVDGAPSLAALQAEIDLLRLQLESGIAVARAEGFEAGLTHARGETAAALLTATDALHASIEAIETEAAAREERLAKVAAEVAMAAADGLAARALGLDPALAIDAAIGRVLLQVARGQELHIHVNPALIVQMEALIEARKGAERRRLSLTLLADPALPVGDALIAWEQGGLALDAAARRAAILTELGLELPDADAALKA